MIASLEDDKAENIVTIDLEGRSALCDAAVIASGRSSRHVAAVAEHLARRLKEGGYGTRPVSGAATGDWVLVDAGDVIVHVFRPEARTFYALEKMWALEDEADIGRPFVVPLFLQGTPEQPPAGSAFAPLWQRIYLPCPADAAAAASALASQLFALASEWIEKAEGSSRKRFIDRLRRDLTRFKDDAYLMLASMGVPIEVLATREEAHAQFAQATGTYAQFAEAFIQRKDGLREQIHGMFGGYLAAEAEKLLAFIDEKVFRGRLYDLNAVVDCINTFATQLPDDRAVLAAADADKAGRLLAARKVLDQMSKRSLDLLAKLELESR